MNFVWTACRRFLEETFDEPFAQYNVKMSLSMPREMAKIYLIASSLA